MASPAEAAYLFFVEAETAQNEVSLPGRPETVLSRPDSRTLVENTEEFPFDNICHVKAKFLGGASGVGTAFLTALQTMRNGKPYAVALTAAHVLCTSESYPISGGRRVSGRSHDAIANSIKLKLALDGHHGINQPTMEIELGPDRNEDRGWFQCSEEWLSNPAKFWEHDYGAIFIPLSALPANLRAQNARIQLFKGDVRHYADQTRRPLLGNAPFAVVGYPSRADEHGGTMWIAKGQLIQSMASIRTTCSPSVLVEHAIDTSSGQSGSPVLFYYHSDEGLRFQAVGIHTKGCDPSNASSKFNVALLLDSRIQSNIQRWIAQPSPGTPNTDSDIGKDSIPEVCTDEADMPTVLSALQHHRSVFSYDEVDSGRQAPPSVPAPAQQRVPTGVRELVTGTAASSNIQRETGTGRTELSVGQYRSRPNQQAAFPQQQRRHDGLSQETDDRLDLNVGQSRGPGYQPAPLPQLQQHRQIMPGGSSQATADRSVLSDGQSRGPGHQPAALPQHDQHGYPTPGSSTQATADRSVLFDGQSRGPGHQPAALPQHHQHRHPTPGGSSQATADRSELFDGQSRGPGHQPAALPQHHQHQYPRTGGSSQATEADLLKLFSRLSSSFDNEKTCESLASYLDIYQCERHQNFVESFQQTHPSERGDFAVISMSILRHWNKEIAKPERWPVEERVDKLLEALQEVHSTFSLFEKCLKLWKDIHARRAVVNLGRDNLFREISQQPAWTNGTRDKPRRSNATKANDNSDLLKLFDSFSRNFISFGMCDSLATELEVNNIGSGFVRQFQSTRADQRENFPAIAFHILKHWNKEVAIDQKSWSVGERLDYLWDVLEVVRSNQQTDLGQACYERWKAISSRRDSSR